MKKIKYVDEASFNECEVDVNNEMYELVEKIHKQFYTGLWSECSPITLKSDKKSLCFCVNLENRNENRVGYERGDKSYKISIEKINQNNNMNNIQEKINQIYDLIIILEEKELVCNVALATILQDHKEYKLRPLNFNMPTYKIEKKGDTYPLGRVGDKDVNVDPFLRYDDTRLFDKSGNLLIDFKNHGFENWNDLI